MSFRPPALEINNQILQAFTQGRQIALERQRLSQQKDLALQQLEAEKQYRGQEINLRQRQLDLEQAQHQLANLAMQQHIGETYSSTGVAPFGSQVERPSTITPQSNDTSSTGAAPVATQASPISTSLGLTPGEVRINVPGIGPMVVPSHEDYLQKRISEAGQIKEAEEAPRRKTALQVQDVESQRAHDVELMKVYQSIVENQNNRSNALDIANIRANAVLAAAKARGRDREAAIASGIGQQFNQHPVSRAYDTLNFAKQIANDPNTSDYELLHQYARAQNPEVASDPQGDLSLIQSLPSLGAQLGAKIDHISAGRTFFDEDQRKQAIKFINLRHQLQEKALSNVRTSFADRIKTTTGEDPEGYLRNAINEKNQSNIDRTIVDTPEGQMKFPDEKSADAFRAKHNLK